MLRTFACVSAVTVCCIFSFSSVAQSGASLSVDAHDAVAAVSPTLYGLMTEEINHAYEGGLYPELLRNATVQQSWKGFDSWRVVEHGSGKATLAEGSDGPSSALPHSLKLSLTGTAPGAEAGLANEGYWGMAVRASTVYQGSFYAKAEMADTAHARLVADATGTVLADAVVMLQPGGWQRYPFTLKTGANVQASAANHFELVFERPGTV